MLEKRRGKKKEKETVGSRGDVLYNTCTKYIDNRRKNSHKAFLLYPTLNSHVYLLKENRVD